MVTQNIEQDNELFKSKQRKNVALVSFKAISIESLSSLEEKQKLLSYFDYLSCNPSIKTVILRSPNTSLDKNNFLGSFHLWSASKTSSYEMLRICRTFDQIMLKIIESNKLFISAQSGKVIFPFFGFSLACDYRVVAENFVLQNPEVKVGLIPKGAEAFFFSRILGPSKTIEILLSDKDINAYELLRLKLVDRVVSFNKLRHTALETARNFASKPVTSLLGVKRLVNYSLNDLNSYLEFENEQLFKFLNMLKPSDKETLNA